MNAKRGPGSPNSQPDPRPDPEYPSTLRSIEVDEEGAADAGPPAARVYFRPQPLVAPSNHKTIEIETVKLAQDIDPRKLRTERRMSRPPPPPDPNGPQANGVVVTNALPVRSKRKRRTWLVLLVIFGVLLLLMLARALAQHSHVAQFSAAPRDHTLPTNAASVQAASPVLPPAAERLGASPNVQVTPVMTAPPALGSATLADGAPAPGSATLADGATPPAPGSATLADGAMPPAPGSATLADGATPPAPGSSTSADRGLHAVEAAPDHPSSLFVPDPRVERAAVSIRGAADESPSARAVPAPQASSAPLTTARSNEPKRAIY